MRQYLVNAFVVLEFILCAQHQLPLHAHLLKQGAEFVPDFGRADALQKELLAEQTDFGVLPLLAAVFRSLKVAEHAHLVPKIFVSLIEQLKAVRDGGLI